jgi:dUTP pyrophosphatase
MKVKFKKINPRAVAPSIQTDSAAGMDLTAISCRIDEERGFIEYDTGLAFEIPEGHVGLIFPRSSIRKTDQTVANCVGVIDSDYRGSVSVTMRMYVNPEKLQNAYMNLDPLPTKGIEVYKPGDRIAQLVIMPYPKIELEESKELSDTKRGTGSHGSTGK